MKRFAVIALTLLCGLQLPAGAQNAPPPPPDLPNNPPPAPPDNPREAASYWVSEGGKTSAKAYSLEEMQAKIAAGQVKNETFIFRVGSADWAKANTDPDLQRLLKNKVPEAPKTEAFERLLVGSWRLDMPTQNGFALWLVVSYRADGKLFGRQFTSLQDGVTPPTTSDFSGTWKVQAGARADEFILETNVMGRTNSSTLRAIDDRTVTDPSTGTTSYKVE